MTLMKNGNEFKALSQREIEFAIIQARIMRRAYIHRATKEALTKFRAQFRAKKPAIEAPA